jgi:hypothetical protein
VIVEPPGLPADRVGAAVRSGWGVDVVGSRHLSVGTAAWHWRVDGDAGPHWFATVEPVSSDDQRAALLAAYDAATHLAGLLPFVVPPVRTRDGLLAVDVAPGMLLSITPFLEGAPGAGPLADDTARAHLAGLLGDLHRQRRPRHLPVWRPRVGRPHAGREELEHCLRLVPWTGGPWSVPTQRLLAEARPVVERALRRFVLLGAAVAGSVDRWVVSHGQPQAENLIGTPDGVRLVDWGNLCLAPRERDLREALGEAEGAEPWFAYVESGGRPDPLSPDTLELFALERHLGEIAVHAVRFSRAHEDGADERRCFGELETRVAGLLERWG